MKLYGHPPRSRQIRLAENMHSLTLTQKCGNNGALIRYYEVDHGALNYALNKSCKDGDLAALIEEVIDNECKYDLWLNCKKDDKWTHDFFKSKHSMLKIVDEKMNCRKHKAMRRPLKPVNMVAFILYIVNILLHYPG